MASLENLNNLYIDAITEQISFEEFLEKFNELVDYQHVSDRAVYSIVDYNYSNKEERAYSNIVQDNEDEVLDLVEEIGGHEGAGEEYYKVYLVKPYKRYIRQDGSYYSYNGVEDCTNFYEVVPVKIEVIEYVPK